MRRKNSYRGIYENPDPHFAPFAAYEDGKFYAKNPQAWFLAGDAYGMIQGPTSCGQKLTVDSVKTSHPHFNFQALEFLKGILRETEKAFTTGDCSFFHDYANALQNRINKTGPNDPPKAWLYAHYQIAQINADGTMAKRKPFTFNDIWTHYKADFEITGDDYVDNHDQKERLRVKCKEMGISCAPSRRGPKPSDDY